MAVGPVIVKIGGDGDEAFEAGEGTMRGETFL
jgi:hypothetical protein